MRTRRIWRPALAVAMTLTVAATLTGDTALAQPLPADVAPDESAAPALPVVVIPLSVIQGGEIATNNIPPAEMAGASPEEGGRCPRLRPPARSRSPA